MFGDEQIDVGQKARAEVRVYPGKQTGKTFQGDRFYALPVEASADGFELIEDVAIADPIQFFDGRENVEDMRRQVRCKPKVSCDVEKSRKNDFVGG